MTKSNDPDTTRAGTFAHFAGLLGVTAQYFGARLRLAGLEAKEAATRYGIAAGLAVAGVFIAILGYLFLVITAVFAIAAAFDARHAWLWVMGAAALVHLGGAAALLGLARRRLKAGAFSDTLAEFKKDQAWLSQQTNKH